MSFSLTCKTLCNKRKKNSLKNHSLLATLNFQHLLGKPIIASEPKNITALVGEATSLRCLAYGSPPLAITWARHGVGNGSELLFQSAKFSDSGWYRCVAKNAHGVSFSSLAYLDVTGKNVNMCMT